MAQMSAQLAKYYSLMPKKAKEIWLCTKRWKWKTFLFKSSELYLLGYCSEAFENCATKSNKLLGAAKEDEQIQFNWRQEICQKGTVWPNCQQGHRCRWRKCFRLILQRKQNKSRCSKTEIHHFRSSKM